MDRCHTTILTRSEGLRMAEEEPILTNPPNQEVARHVRDYSRFVRLLTWGALTCLVIAFIVIIFIL
jgi:hypothetical protein